MLRDIKLMAIIREVDPECVNGIVEVLLAAGINGLGVSLSDPENGFECIRRIQEVFAGMNFNLGPGTVTTRTETDRLAKIGV